MTNASAKTVAVVITVKNDPLGIGVTLSSLAAQSRKPDEVVIVDGGSIDETRRVIDQYQAEFDQFLVMDAPGANIARGRNIGTAVTKSEIIASTDSGCRANHDWLENLVQPFETRKGTDFVAGFYQVESHGLFEQVVGLTTMRGQLEEIDEKGFNPSARSVAFTKELWIRCAGWPDWINYSEDTLFDHKVRSLGVGWYLAKDAIVKWRPRTSLRSVAKQFYGYGTGRGHTQIEADSYRYNIRNLSLILGSSIAAMFLPNAWVVTLALFVYFFVWSFHKKALAVSDRAGTIVSYPICLLVIWIVLLTNTIGYIVGTWQRLRDRSRYQVRMETYLAKA